MRNLMRAIGLAMLALLPAWAAGAGVLRVQWQGLSVVTGKAVTVATPGGAVITGKAIRVEPDALVVRVTKTSDAIAVPKGEMRIPREKLRVLQVRTRGKLPVALGTALGAASGIVLGGAAAFAIDWHGGSSASAWGALTGIAAASTAVGYLAGREAGSRWTSIEVVP